MVWKIPEDVIEINNGINVINTKVLHCLGGFALRSFIKIIIHIKPVFYAYHERLNNMNLSVGFGLHLGWGIEVIRLRKKIFL
jgi:hypothetical protein